MFELLFKYPPVIFEKGRFILLSPFPAWVLLLCAAAAAALLGLVMWSRRNRFSSGLSGWRPLVIWLLQCLFTAALLLLLWRPAVSVATLKRGQNIVAVVVDDSRTMAIREGGRTRQEQAVDVIKGGLLSGLEQKFQVRLYRFDSRLERIAGPAQLTGAGSATHIGDALDQLAAESGRLPLGAIVLLSDGADTSGGVDRRTIAELRSRRIPVHTVGIGREQAEHDLEISDVSMPDRTLAEARVTAQVTLRQHGYSGRAVRLSVHDGERAVATRDLTLGPQGVLQTEPLPFNAGRPGARSFRFSVAPLQDEENVDNNAVTRMLNVEATRPRILYMEGEPRWELKFVRRAVEPDRSLRLTSILRTTQNKIYVQGVDSPAELQDSFPATAESLFAFEGIILGSVEAGYFTSRQQELLRQFMDRRGGGLLFLGGRGALSDGGYARSALAEILPVTLVERNGAFHREQAPFELAPAGYESPICRLADDPARNLERWRKMPALADYQEAGEAKPGALVLLNLSLPGRRPSPLLVTENYGRGRTAVFATGGSWRWRMLQDHADTTHDVFWRQLLRWLVTGARGPVSMSTPRQVLSDDARVPLRVEVRDRSFSPVWDARVEVRILGPAGSSASLNLRPGPLEPGVYVAEWKAPQPGSCVVEAVATREGGELGRDTLTFLRQDGVAENFHTEQNRELLEKLARETGGRYHRPAESSKLKEEISYSEAGITTRETRDLWDMPVVFLLLILMRGAEWFLRRRWGVV